MKILVYNAYALDNNSAAVMLDDALEYLEDPSNEVVFVTCTGQLRPCVTNAEQSHIRCAECRVSTALLMRQVNHPRFVHRSLDEFEDERATQAIAAHQFRYDDLREIKAIEWKGVNIGLSVVSTYVSMTRNLNPTINEWNRSFLDDSLRAEARLVEFSIAMFAEHQPDLVCLFNGRFIGIRAVLETAQLKGLRAKVLENVFSTKIEETSKVEFIDALPHDIDQITPLIESTWQHWDRGTDKTKLASSFFERRRGGQTASDVVYVSRQQESLLPPDWDASKRNFVIFNSSEDEFFSVGASFDKYQLFDAQIEGIRYLAKQAGDDPSIHFYLRVHPNLAPIPYAYHTQLGSIGDEFSNVTVIPATSPISTYALIDHCEKVFVFGSTAGVEAAFWGKPVVLMGGAFYLHLDVAYYARNLDELNRLIGAKLEPKSKLGALKYGLFIFGDRGKPYKHVNFNFRQVKFAGKRLPIMRCYEYRGSILPYAALVAFFRGINLPRHLFFKRVTMRHLSVERTPTTPSARTAG